MIPCSYSTTDPALCIYDAWSTLSGAPSFTIIAVCNTNTGHRNSRFNAIMMLESNNSVRATHFPSSTWTCCLRLWDGEFPEDQRNGQDDRRKSHVFIGSLELVVWRGLSIGHFFGSLMLSLTTGMFWAFYVSPDRIDRGTWKIALWCWFLEPVTSEAIGPCPLCSSIVENAPSDVINLSLSITRIIVLLWID